MHLFYSFVSECSAGAVPDEVFSLLCRADTLKLGGNSFDETTVAAWVCLHVENLKSAKKIDASQKQLRGRL